MGTTENQVASSALNLVSESSFAGRGSCSPSRKNPVTASTRTTFSTEDRLAMQSEMASASAINSSGTTTVSAWINAEKFSRIWSVALWLEWLSGITRSSTWPTSR